MRWFYPGGGCLPGFEHGRIHHLLIFGRYVNKSFTGKIGHLTVQDYFFCSQAATDLEDSGSP